MLIKNKKDKQIAIKQESSLDKIRQEREARELKLKQQAKDKELSDKKETERQNKIIKEYLDKVQTQLKEKDIGNGFWTFVDRKGFKKFTGSDAKIEKMLLGDIERFKNRQLASYTIIFHHNKSNTSMHKSSGLWLNVTVRVYNIDDNAKLVGKNRYRECGITWDNEDFKTGKFSLKLLERFMKPLAENRVDCVSIMGMNLRSVVKKYNKIGVDFSDVLVPLASV